MLPLKSPILITHVINVKTLLTDITIRTFVTSLALAHGEHTVLLITNACAGLLHMGCLRCNHSLKCNIIDDQISTLV